MRVPTNLTLLASHFLYEKNNQKYKKIKKDLKSLSFYLFLFEKNKKIIKIHVLRLIFFSYF